MSAKSEIILLEHIKEYFEKNTGEISCLIKDLSEIIQSTSQMMENDHLWKYCVTLSDDERLWEVLDTVMESILELEEKSVNFEDLRLIKGIVLMIRNLSITQGKMSGNLNNPKISEFLDRNNRKILDLALKLCQPLGCYEDGELALKALDISIVCFHCLFNDTIKSNGKGKNFEVADTINLLDLIYIKLGKIGGIFELKQVIPQFREFCSQKISRDLILSNDCIIIRHLFDAVSRILAVDVDMDLRDMEKTNQSSYRILSLLSHSLSYLFEDERLESSMVRLERNNESSILLFFILGQMTFAHEESNTGRWDYIVIASMCLDFFEIYMNKSIELLNNKLENDNDLILVHRKLIAILDIISNLLQYELFKKTMNSYDFLEKIIVLLQTIEANTERHRLKDVENESVSGDKKSFPFAKTIIIEIITYLVHNDKLNQDIVRERGGLPLILKNCNLDVNEPFIRERCILCLKYLLANNDGNQQYVASLEAKGIEITKENEKILDKCGYEVDIVDGKVKLKQTNNKKVEEL